MATKKAKNRAGLMFAGITGVMLPAETGVTPDADRVLTPVHVTKRRYKRRARKCKCGCGEIVTPTQQAPHKVYFSDACRQREHRRKEAKMRENQPPAEPVLVLATCTHCGNTFLTEAGSGAKYCKPSHRVTAAECRRNAAVAAYVEIYNMPYDNADEMIANVGMKLAGQFLKQQGYQYDESSRRWLVAVQPGDVFAR
ncbi:MAG: hypothetical protein ABI835_19155 [Chloroflexota bacterium]